MQKLIPNYLDVCNTIRAGLLEGITFIDESLEDGADPAYVMTDVLQELKMLFSCIEADSEGH